MQAVELLNQAIHSLVEASIHPEVRELFSEGDEKMLNTTIGALVEWRADLEERE